jgi:queuine tRNA-ribosyltransferase
MKFLNDSKPLDEKCKCEICKRFSRAYICHLLKAGEITGLTYISVHNIAYFHAMIAKIRADIKKGKV